MYVLFCCLDFVSLFGCVHLTLLFLPSPYLLLASYSSPSSLPPTSLPHFLPRPCLLPPSFPFSLIPTFSFASYSSLPRLYLFATSLSPASLPPTSFFPFVSLVPTFSLPLSFPPSLLIPASLRLLFAPRPPLSPFVSAWLSHLLAVILQRRKLHHRVISSESPRQPLLPHTMVAEANPPHLPHLP